jgi:hypothetical protein
MKKNRNIATCNRLGLETRGFRLIMPDTRLREIGLDVQSLLGVLNHGTIQKNVDFYFSSFYIGLTNNNKLIT